jgi:hypothetical protein
MATATLFGTAKIHWRALWPVWVLPVFFYAGLHISDRVGHLDLFLFAIAVPVFVVAFHRPMRLWTDGSITRRQGFFWLGLVPGLISLVCVLIGDVFIGVGRS